VARDRWAAWLAERRFGGDPEVQRQVLAQLAEVRDRVLDAADLSRGDHLLDVGCGEGLIGFGALARGAKCVTFSDISLDLLAACREAAAELGVSDRCEFMEASADSLVGLGDGSVDAVATRSVLIYVKDKRAAFAEFARVLRAGGRISLFEPINRFAASSGSTYLGYDLPGLGEITGKLRAVFEALQPPDSDPMLDFDERDLFRLAEDAGFHPVRLTLEAVSQPLAPRDWDGFVNTSGNPNIPTLSEAMDAALTGVERDKLTAELRPKVETGTGTWRMASGYVAASKP
jgi:ubiquinone/menaquinone biosynthesis C-methylase UbiE